MIQLAIINVSYTTVKQKFTKKDLFTTEVKNPHETDVAFLKKNVLNSLDFSQKLSEDVTTRWIHPIPELVASQIGIPIGIPHSEMGCYSHTNRNKDSLLITFSLY